MEKEGNNPQQSPSNLCSCLVSLVLSTILVLFLPLSLLFFFPVSESSWPGLSLILTIPIVLLSTLFLVKLRKKKGSGYEEDESLFQELKMMQREELQTEIVLINNKEQEAESQSDSSFPSDSETTSGSVMDEEFELNASNITSTSLPSDAETESINGETENFELDQNSTRVLGIYESSDSENEEDGEDDDDLIEINIPSSNFCGSGKEFGERLESKLPDFLPEAMLKQEGLMELLAEMNEDENLIEIDISMGLKQEMPFSGGDLDQYSYSVVAD